LGKSLFRMEDALDGRDVRADKQDKQHEFQERPNQSSDDQKANPFRPSEDADAAILNEVFSPRFGVTYREGAEDDPDHDKKPEGFAVSGVIRRKARKNKKIRIPVDRRINKSPEAAYLSRGARQRPVDHIGRAGDNEYERPEKKISLRVDHAGEEAQCRPAERELYRGNTLRGQKGNDLIDDGFDLGIKSFTQGHSRLPRAGALNELTDQFLGLVVHDLFGRMLHGVSRHGDERSADLAVTGNLAGADGINRTAGAIG